MMMMMMMMSPGLTGLLLVIMKITYIDANLNLYMNSTETKRLLGISGELYYVRGGVVNDYALSFIIPIKSDVDDIYFTWQSLLRPPPESLMYYSMSVSTPNTAVLAQPTPSISMEGIVPSSPTVFSIRLRCTGLVTGEADVRIQLNVTIFSMSNVTTLDFRRKKICVKSDHQQADDFDVLGFINQSSVPVAASMGEGDVSSALFYIGVSSAVGTVFLVTLVVIACFLRHRKSTPDHMYDNSVAQPLTTEKTCVNKSDTHSTRSVISVTVGRAASACVSTYNEIRPVDVRAALHDIQINRAAVSFSDILLEGTFGRIYRGSVLIGSGDCTTVQNVIIKTVTADTRPEQVDVMMTDACALKGVVHDHVMSVVMACVNQLPLLIYTDHTAPTCNLKNFLQHCRLTEALSAQQLVYMAVQIASGVQHIHRRRLLHRDLATRNCLVDSQLHVVVSDSALSRDLFPHDYHCLGDNENRPVKWLAFESLVSRNFSTSSDMWSFGVTMWELFTLGVQPYADIDPFEMESYLEDGYRVTQPHNCPSDLFAVMSCCWSLNVDERPRFSQMLTCLQDLYTALSRFV